MAHTGTSERGDHADEYRIGSRFRFGTRGGRGGERSIRDRSGHRASQCRDQGPVPGHRTRREVCEVIRCQ
jgi:hypothetical protein